MREKQSKTPELLPGHNQSWLGPERPWLEQE